jgi:hypothetical protein
MRADPAETIIFYLARIAEGAEPILRFLNATDEFNVGLACRFVIIQKGSNNVVLSEDLKKYASERRFEIVKIPDFGLDVDTYWSIGRRYQAKYSLFLNTFSEPLVENWGELLLQHAGPDRLVGATGNWESFAWRRGMFGKVFAEGVRNVPRKLIGLCVNRLLWPRFPNPAIRTNAFLVSREVLNSVRSADGTKRSAYRFESGRNGLSATVRKQGGALLIVGRDGKAYSERDWPSAGIFRSRNQENLLIADNRTREYANASSQRRSELSTISWGRDER